MGKVLKVAIPNPTLHLGLGPQTVKGLPIHSCSMLCPIASKKALTRKWMTTDSPTNEDWMNVMRDVHVEEKLTFAVGRDVEKFKHHWDPRITCV